MLCVVPGAGDGNAFGQTCLGSEDGVWVGAEVNLEVGECTAFLLAAHGAVDADVADRHLLVVGYIRDVEAQLEGAAALGSDGLVVGEGSHVNVDVVVAKDLILGVGIGYDFALNFVADIRPGEIGIVGALLDSIELNVGRSKGQALFHFHGIFNHVGLDASGIARRWLIGGQCATSIAGGIVGAYVEVGAYLEAGLEHSVLDFGRKGG